MTASQIGLSSQQIFEKTYAVNFALLLCYHFPLQEGRKASGIYGISPATTQNFLGIKEWWFYKLA